MWPKSPTYWNRDGVLHVSIPFTWNLALVKQTLSQRSFLWDRAIVGGPAVRLHPGYFSDIEYISEGEECHGFLQRINQLATKTTIGCTRHCRFCAVPKTEGAFRELDDWPDLPIICDNNLLAASDTHLERVMERLVRLGQADFNQGIDARLLTQRHAEMIAEIKEPIVRLSLDSEKEKTAWSRAYEYLRSAGIAKHRIRTYCLIAFNDGPAEAWARCQWVDSHGLDAYPMWFHPLDATNANTVTDEQYKLGWDNQKRRDIMQWFYQHKKAVVA
jgi:hypothetical protein